MLRGVSADTQPESPWGWSQEGSLVSKAVAGPGPGIWARGHLPRLGLAAALPVWLRSRTMTEKFYVESGNFLCIYSKFTA